MIVVIMGVSGSGKTTLAEVLSDRLGAECLEADRYHPPENVAHMRAGKPLNDAMRWPWLKALARAAREASARGPVVVTCSALKRSYRDVIRDEAGAVTFLFLDGPRRVLEERVSSRRHEYMPASLLDSQLGTLEPPEPDEADCIRLDFTLAPQALADAATAALASRGGSA